MTPVGGNTTPTTGARSTSDTTTGLMNCSHREKVASFVGFLKEVDL